MKLVAVFACFVALLLGALVTTGGSSPPLSVGRFSSIEKHAEQEKVNAAKASVRGDSNAAVSHYEEALLLTPNNTHTKFMLSMALHKAGRMPEAASAFENVMRTKAAPGSEDELWVKSSRAMLANIAKARH